MIVHRIELQKTERDMLEAAVMVNAVGKVGQAAGAILAPFAGAMTAIIAALLAKSTVEDIVGWAGNKLGEKEHQLATGYAAYLEHYYAAIGAVHPPGHENEGQPLSPAPHRPPMSRKTYDDLYEKTAMTNWELIQWRVAETTGGVYGSTEFQDAPGERPPSYRDADQIACMMITSQFGRAVAESYGVCRDV